MPVKSNSKSNFSLAQEYFSLMTDILPLQSGLKSYYVKTGLKGVQLSFFTIYFSKRGLSFFYDYSSLTLLPSSE